LVSKEFRRRIQETLGRPITAADRVFAVAEFSAGQPEPLQASTLDVSDIAGPHPVRLVRAELAQLKASRPSAGYLVEWDLPDGLDMDSYLDFRQRSHPN
jgi:hypothetical protein